MTVIHIQRTIIAGLNEFIRNDFIFKLLVNESKVLSISFHQPSGSAFFIQYINTTNGESTINIHK
jgi:hypothetical protein